MAQPTSTTSLRDVYRILFRHQHKALGLFALIMACVVAAILLLPKSYQSEGKIFLRVGRENATFDPAMAMGQDMVVNVPEVSEKEVLSVVDLLQSRGLMESVVDRVGADAILDDEPAEPGDTREAALFRDAAIRHVEESILVEPVKDTAVIRIAYEGHSPHVAQQVIAALIEVYKLEHAQLHRTPGAHDFLAQQTDEAYRRLANDEEALRQLQNATGVVAPEQQRQILVQRIGSLQQDLTTTEALLDSSVAEARLLRESLSGIHSIQVTGRTNGLPLNNEAASPLRSKLYNLQLEKQELLAKYTPEHFEVQQVQNQIDSAKKVLAESFGSGDGVASEGEAGKPLSREALIAREPALAALHTKAQKLRAQLASAQKELAGFNDDQLLVARLKRQVQLSDEAYRKFSSNLEQARIDDLLLSQRISNISVAQHATLDLKPVGPKRGLLLMLGLIVATAASLGLPFVCEYFDHSVKSSDDVEQNLALPTLITIPRMHDHHVILSGQN